MPNFKPKNTKKIMVNKKTNITLDEKHKELSDDFRYQIDVVLPNLQEEKQQLKTKLNITAFLIA